MPRSASAHRIYLCIYTINQDAPASAFGKHSLSNPVTNERMKIEPLVCALLAVALILSAACTNLPLRRPKSDIQNWVLDKAPLGSSIAEVKSVIARNRWKINLDWKGTNSKASTNSYPYVQGTQILAAYLGGYQGLPWRADVDAFWGFDEDGKLIEFCVRKYYDGP
jgi:hypothetical protein